jgi:hypothetical protein
VISVLSPQLNIFSVSNCFIILCFRPCSPIPAAVLIPRDRTLISYMTTPQLGKRTSDPFHKCFTYAVRWHRIISASFAVRRLSEISPDFNCLAATNLADATVTPYVAFAALTRAFSASFVISAGVCERKCLMPSESPSLTIT